MPAYTVSYPSAVLADSPAGFWRLADANPPTAADSSGNGRDGTYVGGVTLRQPGPLVEGGGAALFDGSTAWITVPDVGVDVGDVFTLEMWHAPVDYAVGRWLISKGTGSFAVAILATTGLVRLTSEGGSTIVDSTVAFPTGGWHHLAITKSGATVKVYLDGVDVTGAVVNSTLVDTTDPLHIGRRVGTAANPVMGLLDEVALYPTALTAARVLAHFNAGKRILAGAAARPSRSQLSAVLVADGVQGDPRRVKYASYGAATPVPGAPTFGVAVVTEAQAALAWQQGREVVSLTRFAAGAVIPPQYRRIAEAAAE